MLRSSGEHSHMEVLKHTVPYGKVTETTKLSARTQIIVKGMINNCNGLKGEKGFIEPTSVKKGLLIALNVSKVDAKNEVPMNMTMQHWS